MYKVSCQNLHLEKILVDTSAAFTTDTAIDFSTRLISLNFEPNNLEAKVDADGATRESFFATPEGKVTIVISRMTPAERAAIFGNTSVGAIRGGGDSSAIPYYLVKYEEVLSDGTIIYKEILKVKFVPGAQNIETQKSDGINPQFVTLEGTAIVRTYKHANDPTANNLYYEVSDADGSYADEGTTWYSLGDNLSTPDVVAPTIDSVTPADEATDVAIASNIVWVFDKGILSSTMTDANFILFKDEDDSIVAGALSLGTDSVANDEVTFNPTSNLTNNTKYKAVVTKNVKSTAGVNLAANSITYFTTVAD